jgi:hypothetical protein
MLFPSGPPTKINKIPIIPKAMDEYMNTRVAIFCMVLLYQDDELNKNFQR